MLRGVMESWPLHWLDRRPDIYSNAFVRAESRKLHRRQFATDANANDTRHPFVIGRLLSKSYAFFTLICFLSTRFTVDGFLSPTSAVHGQHYDKYNNSSPSTCPNCLTSRDALRAYNLEEIKYQLLIKLGFTSGTPPNITANKLQTNADAVVKQLMSSDGPFSIHRNRHKEDLQRIHRDDDDDDRLKTKFLAIIGKPCSASTNCKNYRNRSPVTFVFEKKTLQNKIIAATLNFYQKASVSDNAFNVSIFKYNSRATSASNQFVHEISIENKLTSYGRWIEIDLKEALNKHFRHNDVTNISLFIVVSPSNKNTSSMLVTEVKKDDDNQYTPFLKIHTEEPKNRRSKRSAGLDCKDDQHETTCCRYPLVVDFEKFEWDFIIQPKRYDAYYCSGECNVHAALNFPHTSIVQLMPDNPGHVPCCGPRKMAAISMIYFNEHGNIIFSNVPEMVVEKCGCS